MMPRLKSSCLSLYCAILALCIPSVTHAYDAQSADAQLLRITPMPKAPTIDGVLTPGEWNGAVQTNNFHVLGSNNVPGTTQSAWVGYDSQNLYLAVSVTLPKGQAPIAVQRERDGAIWQDEGVELFIDPMHTNMTSYQFSCNAVGSIGDTKDKDAAWNGVWTAKTSAADGAWYLEMAIPFSTLGISPSSADRMIGFNVCLDRKGPDANLTWAPLLETGGFHQPSKFGHLVLANQNGGVSALQMPSNDGFDFMVSGMSMAVVSKLETSNQGKAVGSETSEGDTPARLHSSIADKGKEPVDGVYDWKVTVIDQKSGDLLLRQTGSKEVWNSVKLSLRRYFLQGRLGVDVVVPTNPKFDGITTCSTTIIDKQGNRLLSESKSVDTRVKKIVMYLLGFFSIFGFFFRSLGNLFRNNIFRRYYKSFPVIGFGHIYHP